MQDFHHRAFKEWAVSCEALLEGRQTLLIRKGGIREEQGVFRMNDTEFFLFPTYEHQKASLLLPEWQSRLERLSAAPHDPATVVLSAYAVVETIAVAQNDAQVNALASEHIWNSEFVKMRFDYNPYDPLYLVLLRVYRLPEPLTIPMLPDYEGCKSWITLAESLSTAYAVPVLSEEAFVERRSAVLDVLKASIEQNEPACEVRSGGQFIRPGSAARG